MIQPTNIIHQVQVAVKNLLQAQIPGVPWLDENRKDIDFQIKAALNRQGVFGLISIQEADFSGMVSNEFSLSRGTLEVNKLTVSVCGNPNLIDLKSGLPDTDAIAHAAAEVLAGRHSEEWMDISPVSVSTTQKGTLVQADAIFRCTIHGEIPKPYAYEVEYCYISKKSECGIIVDFPWNNNLVSYIKISAQPSSVLRTVLSFRRSTPAYNFRIRGNTSNFYVAWNGSKLSVIGDVPVLETPVEFEGRRQSFSVNGTQYAIATETEYATSDTVTLFSFGEGYVDYLDIRIHNVKISSESGEVLLDLVPVVDNEGNAAYYDKISRDLHYPYSSNTVLSPGPRVSSQEIIASKPVTLIPRSNMIPVPIAEEEQAGDGLEINLEETSPVETVKLDYLTNPFDISVQKEQIIEENIQIEDDFLEGDSDEETT